MPYPLQFLHETDHNAYPFVDGQDFSLGPAMDPDTDDFGLEGSDNMPVLCEKTTLNLPRHGIADAGFVIGKDFYFLAGWDYVRLHALTVRSDTSITFDFRTTSAGSTERRWLVAVGAGSKVNCTWRVPASDVNKIQRPEAGFAFVTVGDLKEILDLGIGRRLLCGVPAIEPARVVTLSSGITGISLANRARPCAPGCDQMVSPQEFNKVYPVVQNITGDVKLRAGYNSSIIVDETRSSVTFDAGIGFGKGEPCSNTVINSSGMFHDSCDDNCNSSVRSINGSGADSDQNLTILAGSGIAIKEFPDEHKIQILRKYLPNC